ncbi:MFS transporter [Rhizobium sp. SYY.PMSO]|uniref:MFS transporter n=1 Tax=Rhizobium sp. SYY.PMSO TaxID=3382192 RepID=UPI00398FA229
MDQDANVAPDQLRPRSVRSFFLLSVLFSAAGRNAYYVGAIWILAEAGNSAESIALFLALGSISEFLASAPVGYLVDRFDRTRLCLAGDAIRIAILIITAAVMIKQTPNDTLYVSAVFYAAADRLYLTASSAIIPSITASERLVGFNSLAYAAMQVGNMLAAVITGWLLGATVQTVSFLFAAGTFAISMLSMPQVTLRLPNGATHDRCAPQPCSETSEGEKAARVPRFLVASYVLIYAMGMLVSALMSKFVLLELGGTAFEFGLLEFSWGAGAMISMLILTLRCFSRAGGSVIPIIVFSSGVAMAALCTTRDLNIACVLVTILGAGYNLSRVLIDVEIQKLIAGAKLGRAKGRMHAICMGFSLTIYAALTAVGDGVGPSTVFLAFGLGMIACIIAGYLLNFARSKSSKRREARS